MWKHLSVPPSVRVCVSKNHKRNQSWDSRKSNRNLGANQQGNGAEMAKESAVIICKWALNTDVISASPGVFRRDRMIGTTFHLLCQSPCTLQRRRRRRASTARSRLSLIFQLSPDYQFRNGYFTSQTHRPPVKTDVNTESTYIAWNGSAEVAPPSHGTLGTFNNPNSLHPFNFQSFNRVGRGCLQITIPRVCS